MLKRSRNYYVLLLFVAIPFTVLADGNTKIESFSKTKKLLLNDVYLDIPKRTIYCSARFDSKKKIVDPNGFYSTKYKKRGKKLEWEHVVPAENFGRTFKSWRVGHPDCVNRKGEHFKGRRCANKVSREYRLMQADMYNLYPAIGAVNALRSNYNMAMLSPPSKQLGKCEIQIDSKRRKVEPPNYAKGMVARTYLYMEQAYSRYHMSRSQRKLMEAWDRMYPVTQVECSRLKVIERLQGSKNVVLLGRCSLN